jgi:hypothetical protein
MMCETEDYRWSRGSAVLASCVRLFGQLGFSPSVNSLMLGMQVDCTE